MKTIRLFAVVVLAIAAVAPSYVEAKSPGGRGGGGGGRSMGGFGGGRSMGGFSGGRSMGGFSGARKSVSMNRSVGNRLSSVQRSTTLRPSSFQNRTKSAVQRPSLAQSANKITNPAIKAGLVIKPFPGHGHHHHGHHHHGHHHHGHHHGHHGHHHGHRPWHGPIYGPPVVIRPCPLPYPTTTVYQPSAVVVQEAAPVVVTEAEQPVDSLPTITERERTSLAVSGLGTAAGSVLLKLSDRTLRAEIEQWADGQTIITAPDAGLTAPVRATLTVLLANGQVHSESPVLFLPAQPATASTAAVPGA